MVRNGIKIGIAAYCKERKQVKDKESLRYVLEVENRCPFMWKGDYEFFCSQEKAI